GWGGLEEGSGADQLGRSPVSDAHLERQHALQDEQAHAAVRYLEPAGEVALADVDLQQLDGSQLAGADARADVELLGEVVVEVEQVPVQRPCADLSPHRPVGPWPPQPGMRAVLLGVRRYGHTPPRGRHFDGGPSRPECTGRTLRFQRVIAVTASSGNAGYRLLRGLKGR